MAERTGLEGLRILIVEDNLFATLELEQTLLAFGCQPVGPVARLDQAMSIALHEDLDGALLDVELQGQLVFTVAAELQRRQIPMIFASGYGTDDIFPAAFVHHPRLAKPFGEDDVRRALAAILAGRVRSISGRAISPRISESRQCQTARDRGIRSCPVQIWIGACYTQACQAQNVPAGCALTPQVSSSPLAVRDAAWPWCVRA